MRALIDGDVIVYQAGFASDKRTYYVGQAEFAYKKDANAYAKSIGYDPKNITKSIEPEPIEHCLHSVKKMIEGIVFAVDADEVEVVLSGKTNFRDALVPDYKANRDPSAKPIWYPEIREYLENVHGAIVTDGVEADDLMATLQSEDIASRPPAPTGALVPLDAETCICTVDKDLDMIAGWHYNWRKEAMVWITQEEADRKFFEQWLTGDTADNIHGIKGVGPKSAEKLLAHCHDAKQMWESVMSEYVRQTKRTFQDIHTVGDLIWMQRKGPTCTWDQYFDLSTDRLQLEGERDDETQALGG